jgi:hypothetical protein
VPGETLVVEDFTCVFLTRGGAQSLADRGRACGAPSRAAARGDRESDGARAPAAPGRRFFDAISTALGPTPVFDLVADLESVRRPLSYTFRADVRKTRPARLRDRALPGAGADGRRGRPRETERYTTVSTERTVLRLLGVDGVDADEVPLPNRIVDALQKAGRLSRGAAVWMAARWPEARRPPRRPRGG